MWCLTKLTNRELREDGLPDYEILSKQVMCEQKYSMVLRQCRLLGTGDRATVDIAIDDNTIFAVSPRISGFGEGEIDTQGNLVSPPFVESQIYLDSTLTAGEPRWNQSGTLFEGIQIWGERKQYLTLDDVKKRAIETLKFQASQGILFVRSHADVSEPMLTALQGFLEVREQVKDWMTFQVVAFPQDEIYRSRGNDQLLEKALDMGADAVGGIPHYELTREDGVKSVHRIFELAEKYDKLIDIHCDEIDGE
jgi:cytosine deaminase